jgi:hypothetical protein
MSKQLINFVTCGCESSAPFFAIYKAGTGHHDIAESGVKHQKSINQSKEIIGLRGRPE